MSLAALTKTPGDILDYAFDYSVWIGTDVISTSTWTVPNPLTKVSDSFDSDSATAFISGGKVGETYKIVNTIVTVALRTKQVSFNLKIIDV